MMAATEKECGLVRMGHGHGLDVRSFQKVTLWGINSHHSVAGDQNQLQCKGKSFDNVKKISGREPTLGDVVPLTDAKKNHNQLCVSLDDLITEDAFMNIKRMSLSYLGRKTVEKAKDMHELLSALELKGVIGIGNYDILIEIMTGAGVGIGIVEIQKTAKAIKDIMQKYFHNQEQTTIPSLEAHTSNQDSIHIPSPAKKKKRKKCVSESSSDSSSDSESESVTSSDSVDEVAIILCKRKKTMKQKLRKKQKRRKY